MKIKILFVFILAVSILAGCSGDEVNSDINPENAVENFNSALDKFFASDSYTVSANTSMNVSTGDKVGAWDMSAELKAKNDSNGNKEAEIKTAFNMEEQTEEIEGYFKDGFFYNSQNRKIKSEYSDILTEGNINIFKLTNNVLTPNIPPVIKITDEGTEIEFDLNVAVLQQETPEFVPKLTSYLRVSEYDFIMSKCKIYAFVGNDGILRYCNFDIIAKDTLYEGTNEQNFNSLMVDCDIKINVAISDINSTKFDLPNDLDSYTEVTQNTNS